MIGLNVKKFLNSIGYNNKMYDIIYYNILFNYTLLCLIYQFFIFFFLNF